MSRASTFVKFAVLVALLASAVYFFRFTETGRSVTAESARDYIQDQDPLVARLIYVAAYIVGTVILLPGTVLSFAGAVLFGVWEGTLYTWIGATIGAALAFLLAKNLGREFVDHLLKGKFQSFDRRIRDHGFLGLLIIRLIPLFPFNGVNFGSGLTSIRFRDYLLATAIGILPGTFVYQYLFSRVGRTHSWRDPELLAALVLFLLFIVAGGWMARRLQKPAADKRASSDENEEPKK
jgi:uncharacterized membrane protein YdjX (TVP38/TMEM64 family)